MANALGLNVLAQTVKDRAALLSFVERAQPAACVVMDGHDVAQTIRQRSPKTTVFYRAYNPNDARWHSVLSPEDWLTAHKPFAVNGIVVQCFNEPAPENILFFLTWLEKLVALCPADMTLAFPAFSVGNPYEQDIMHGVYDRLLRLVCGARHWLMLHEYLRDKPMQEAPYLCGRYGFWLDRADDLKLLRPKIVMGEHGRDVGGGHNDGWRGTGWSQAEYFARLVQAQAIYEGEIPVCLYCWGTGGNNDWLSFDIEDASELQALIVQYGKDHPLKESVMPVPPTVNFPPSPGAGVLSTLRKEAAGLRLRADANGALLRTLEVGEAVTTYPDTVKSAAGFAWVFLRDAAGGPGWAALRGAWGDSFQAVDTPPEAWTVKLDVPYVSQTSIDADLSFNDCGLASLLMLTRFWCKQHGLTTPEIPRVDDLVPYTLLGQPNPPKGLTFTQIGVVASLMGFKTTYRQPLTMDELARLLDAGKPVMVLLDYSAYSPNSKPLAHILVVHGYSAANFLTSDPYTLGGNVTVSRATLEQAMKHSPGNSIGFQGMTLAV